MPNKEAYPINPAFVEDGKRLKAALSRAGLTQEQFALKMGVPAPTVSRWITGRWAFNSYGHRVRACTILKCTLHDLDGDQFIEIDPLLGYLKKPEKPRRK